MNKHFALLAVLPAVSILAGCSTQTLEDGVITVGMECGYAPFNWTTDVETDTTVAIADSSFLCDGFDVRVSSYLAEELGYDLQIRKIEWDGLIPALTSGNIDAIIGGMTDTPSRRETIAFSSPYFETRSVMIVLPGSTYASALTVDDFAGANVVGQAGTLQDDIIAGYAETNGWIHGTAYPTYPDALTALLSGASGIDAILAEEPFAQQMLAQYPNDLELISLEREDGALDDDFLITVSVGLRQEDTTLLDEIETALATLSQATRLQWMNEASEAVASIS
jgi:ABC-type amino acid transport substrate-binding protein